MSRIRIILTVLLVTLGLGTGLASAAYADGGPNASPNPHAASVSGSAAGTPAPANPGGTAICGNAGSGYCMNDWNGNSGQVKMYYGGYSNENFTIFNISNMCNHGIATSTCPINVSGINPTGGAIEEFQYNNTSQCAGTNGSAQMVLVTCSDTNGNGGGNGVIFVRFTNQSCNAGNQVFALNRYWTDTDQTWVWDQSGGAVGVQAFFYRGTSGFTCWGWVNN